MHWGNDDLLCYFSIYDQFLLTMFTVYIMSMLSKQPVIRVVVVATVVVVVVVCVKNVLQYLRKCGEIFNRQMVFKGICCNL